MHERRGEIAANENKRAVTCEIQETKKRKETKKIGGEGMRGKKRKKREYNTKSFHSLF
jgi:hypothetical protein